GGPLSLSPARGSGGVLSFFGPAGPTDWSSSGACIASGVGSDEQTIVRRRCCDCATVYHPPMHGKSLGLNFHRQTPWDYGLPVFESFSKKQEFCSRLTISASPGLQNSTIWPTSTLLWSSRR